MEDSNPLTILPASALLEAAPAQRSFVLDPVLEHGTIALVYGQPGVGKSFLALGLAWAAAAANSIFGWTAASPRRVLYLDGEMTREAVTARLRLFGPTPPSLQMWLATEQEGHRLDLSDMDGLLRLVRSWGNPDLLIIDSLSSLVGGVPGRDPERWSEMRYFLGLQQSAGRAVVMVHHANRDGAMRGIGKRADSADLIMALRRPRDWRPSDGARFELRVEKHRHLTGEHLIPIEAQLCTRPDGIGEWRWHRGGSRDLWRARPLFQQGMSAEAVARAIGVSPRKGYRLQSRARERGWIERRSS